LRADYFAGHTIGRVDLAATGPRSPVPPGIARLPRAGEYYASPALAALLRHTPDAELADRYPGRLIGTLGAAALPSPDSLIVVVGHSAAEMSRQPRVRRVSSISTTVPGDCSGDCAIGVGTNRNGLILILSVVAAALLFPLLILVGSATRLSAARREQRFAAMRLVGATPRQIATISTIESSLASVGGVVGGFGVFFALRTWLAKIPFTGDRFFPGDLSLTVLDVLLVGLGVPLAAAGAARFALRRVNVSPLGVTRRVTPKPPRAWRVIPLVGGVAELSYFAYVHNIGAQTPDSSPMLEAVVFLFGVLLVMSGLVIAGPWLTMVASRLVVRRANRPAALLAARRLADNPKAGFRAISGLALAVFVGSCAAAIITAIVANSGDLGRVDTRLAHTLVDELAGPDQPRVTSFSPATESRLTSIRGVAGVAVIRDQRINEPSINTAPINTASINNQSIVGPIAITEVVSCRDLARVPALGRCPAGASVVKISPDFGGGFLHRSAMPDITWPPSGITTAQFRGLRIDTVAVGTDGSRAAIERARTVLDLAYPGIFAAQTVTEIHSDSARLLSSYRRLAEIVVLASLPIAGCSLAVNIVGGLAERRRPFSLLRLSGTPIRVLRGVVGWEAAAPTLVTAAASLGAGLLAAHLFLRAQLGESLHPLGAGFYAVVAAGVVAALLIAASVLPMLNRMTGPDIARND
jgi:hypothetical protein